jgi:hypothetical protein
LETHDGIAAGFGSGHESGIHGVDSMKWLLAGVIGSVAGWIIVSITEEVAIAVTAGGAIGFLATIALFGTRPLQAVVKVAGAMALGCLAGWLVASLTASLKIAMMIGMAIGALATIALASERPVHSLLKVIGTMGFGFAAGWAIGYAVGDHRIGMILAIPLGLPLLAVLADSISLPRRRPF